jgi:hypothetical protein
LPWIDAMIAAHEKLATGYASAATPQHIPEPPEGRAACESVDLAVHLKVSAETRVQEERAPAVRDGGAVAFNPTEKERAWPQ